jgi:hypothetical protein
VGVLFFDNSHCGWGVSIFPGRKSTKIKGLTRSTQATQVRFVRKIRENTGSDGQFAILALLDMDAVRLPSKIPSTSGGSTRY